MKTLLHVCCAPCSIASIEKLNALGHDVNLLWFNPNIHPYKEYQARKNTMVDYAKSVGMKLHLEGEYGLEPFIRAVYPDLRDRCGVCYKMRFDFAAHFAQENGYDAFTSSLFISPYQNHEKMKEVADAAAETNGIVHAYVDFRPFFREGQDAAREQELYMQKYCGCIFSEEERYRRFKKQRSGL